MKKSSTYRAVAAFVAAVFLVFNAGLPIVLASCPMSDTRALVCDMCSEESSDQKITSTKNTSCCATVVAADKNTPEFIQSKAAVREQSNVVAATPPMIYSNDFSQQILSSFQAFSPPFIIDIPIFTSSLLI